MLPVRQAAWRLSASYRLRGASHFFWPEQKTVGRIWFEGKALPGPPPVWRGSSTPKCRSCTVPAEGRAEGIRGTLSRRRFSENIREKLLIGTTYSKIYHEKTKAAGGGHRQRKGASMFVNIRVKNWRCWT